MILNDSYIYENRSHYVLHVVFIQSYFISNTIKPDLIMITYVGEFIFIIPSLYRMALNLYYFVGKKKFTSLK